MVGEIIYFLHRHVRVATPIAVVVLAAVMVLTFDWLGHVASTLTR